MALADKLNVARIAIIGAGPSGLAAAKYFLAEKKFSKIQLFEQRATPGGVWNYTPLVREQGFTVPRTQPSSLPDQAIWPKEGGEVEFMSPIYDLLETNIHHSLMRYSDTEFPQGSPLFPKHSAVLQYLKEYAEELTPYISYQTQVLNVEKSVSQPNGPWQVELLDLKANKTTKIEFDAVVVASGHYNDPFIPHITGLVEFDKAYPGAVSHSKFYRRPDDYKGKKVIVVGNSASGVDVSVQLSTVAKLPVFVSEKEKPTIVQPQADTPWAEYVPEIVEFLPEQRGVRFANGRVELDIDSVVFCTGFHYSYPFLKNVEPAIVVPSGSHADHLWEHILYTSDPTLAFLSVPQRIVPLPISEAQSAVIGRIWSGRLSPPSKEEMDAWVDDQHKVKGEGKAIHVMASAEDVDYINRLHHLSGTATKAPELGLENDGEGKRPPYWDPETRWVRERVPKIKLASRAVGVRRHELRTLKDLGIDYEEWKKSAAAEGGQ
ncbi:monooxygenase [Neonectria magnoliae]|uniref:Monooxygenase n=1 Tax=Neonectria magnoliae TaxID=2732573 RepID=A0ABR1IBC5_9HYPO